MADKPAQIFICVNLCSSVANYAPTWTDGLLSIAQFSFSILCSSFPSACTWGGRRKISKTSRLAAAEFLGGQYSRHWWLPKRVPAHFSEHPAKDLRCAITPTYSSPSVRSSDAFSSAIFSSNRITTTKSIRSMSISLPGSECRRRTRLRRFS